MLGEAPAGWGGSIRKDETVTAHQEQMQAPTVIPCLAQHHYNRPQIPSISRSLTQLPPSQGQSTLCSGFPGHLFSIRKNLPLQKPQEPDPKKPSLPLCTLLLKLLSPFVAPHSFPHHHLQLDPSLPARQALNC